MILSVFANFDKGTWVMVALAVIVGAYLWWLERRDKKAKLGACEQYATLTEETLAALPDGEVVRAVAANVVKKQETEKSDLAAVLPFLSPGRRGVYGIWLVCNELDTRGLDAYFRSPYRRFAPVIAEGFAMVGAAACVAAWGEACARYEAQKNGEKGLPSWDEYTARMRDAVKDEQPLSLCVAYIRDNAAEFVDQSAT
ncbi:MAG: hypothetical protein IJO59_02595 [Clostridia bacterium]|nr:hypothetical protein [Clostridia bacterium]